MLAGRPGLAMMACGEVRPWSFPACATGPWRLARACPRASLPPRSPSATCRHKGRPSGFACSSPAGSGCREPSGDGVAGGPRQQVISGTRSLHTTLRNQPSPRVRRTLPPFAWPKDPRRSIGARRTEKVILRAGARHGRSGGAHRAGLDAARVSVSSRLIPGTAVTGPAASGCARRAAHRVRPRPGDGLGRMAWLAQAIFREASHDRSSCRPGTSRSGW